jgi:hypothetical protein
MVIWFLWSKVSILSLLQVRSSMDWACISKSVLVQCSGTEITQMFYISGKLIFHINLCIYHQRGKAICEFWLMGGSAPAAGHAQIVVNIVDLEWIFRKQAMHLDEAFRKFSAYRSVVTDGARSTSKVIWTRSFRESWKMWDTEFCSRYLWWYQVPLELIWQTGLWRFQNPEKMDKQQVTKIFHR